MDESEHTTYVKKKKKSLSKSIKDIYQIIANRYMKFINIVI